MTKHPAIPMCSSAVYIFNDEDVKNMNVTKIPKHKLTIMKHIPRLIREDKENTKKEWITNHPTMMMRKSAVIEVGNYQIGSGPTKYREDWDLIQRVLEKYGEIHNLQQVLGYYRLHDNQTSLNLRKLA
jgi:hypothetical protein